MRGHFLLDYPTRAFRSLQFASASSLYHFPRANRCIERVPLNCKPETRAQGAPSTRGGPRWKSNDRKSYLARAGGGPDDDRPHRALGGGGLDPRQRRLQLHLLFLRLHLHLRLPLYLRQPLDLPLGLRLHGASPPCEEESGGGSVWGGDEEGRDAATTVVWDALTACGERRGSD